MPIWAQDEGLDLVWTGMLLFRDDGIDDGELFFALTDACYDQCTNLTCTQACLTCNAELVRAAYGLE